MDFSEYENIEIFIKTQSFSKIYPRFGKLENMRRIYEKFKMDYITNFS